ATVTLSNAPWFNPTEGTLFVDFQRLQGVITETFAMQIDDGTDNNRIVISQDASSGSRVFRARCIVGGVETANITVSSGNANIRGKAVFAYKENDFAFYVNGTAGTPDISGALPTGF